MPKEGPKEMSMRKEMSMSNQRGGHLYMQTNEIQNCVMHYHWSASGAITEVERCPTGGAGSGTFKPISDQESATNAFEGAGSVILSPDRRFLFATNGGDNSVSSFSVVEDGRLKLLDVKPTGNAANGNSGTAKSLAYDPSRGMLFVVHSFGPDHIRQMSVDGQGKLTTRPERYSVNTEDKPNRVPTMGVISPDGRFLLVGTTFDLPIAISAWRTRWVERMDTQSRSATPFPMAIHSTEFAQSATQFLRFLSRLKKVLMTRYRRCK
jgi:hypothetical protein